MRRVANFSPHPAATRFILAYIPLQVNPCGRCFLTILIINSIWQCVNASLRGVDTRAHNGYNAVVSFFDGEMKIRVSAASGTEAVLKRELLSLGYAPGGAEYGRVDFVGNMRDVARANVFLRTAGRVRIVLAEFPARTFDELYESVRGVRWKDILPPDAAVAVSAKSLKSALFSLRDIQRVTKRAIADAMCARTGARMPENGEKYDIEVSLTADVAAVTLDTSGAGLHKRGYRVKLGEAPIRETLAAAMLLLSVWRADRPFIDPFCGSGTIPVEAALIGTDTAPGIRRNFSFESFSSAPPVIASVRDEAEQLIKRDAALRIRGGDIDPAALKLAREHAARAGMDKYIHFQTQDVKDLSSRFSHGVIVTNPPYGERLMNGAELGALYGEFGRAFARLDEWSAYVITSSPSFEKYFGRKADRVRTLYNSELECRFYRFLGAPPKNRAETADAAAHSAEKDNNYNEEKI